MRATPLLTSSHDQASGASAGSAGAAAVGRARQQVARQAVRHRAGAAPGRPRLRCAARPSDGAPAPSQAVAAVPGQARTARSDALASLSLHLARSTNIDRRLSVAGSTSALQASSTRRRRHARRTKLASSRPLARAIAGQARAAARRGAARPASAGRAGSWRHRRPARGSRPSRPGAPRLARIRRSGSFMRQLSWPDHEPELARVMRWLLRLLLLVLLAGGRRGRCGVVVAATALAAGRTDRRGVDRTRPDPAPRGRTVGRGRRAGAAAVALRVVPLVGPLAPDPRRQLRDRGRHHAARSCSTRWCAATRCWSRCAWSKAARSRRCARRWRARRR